MKEIKYIFKNKYIYYVFIIYILLLMILNIFLLMRGVSEGLCQARLVSHTSQARQGERESEKIGVVSVESVS